jgi:hypothetical protein
VDFETAFAAMLSSGTGRLVRPVACLLQPTGLLLAVWVLGFGKYNELSLFHLLDIVSHECLKHCRHIFALESTNNLETRVKFLGKV